MTSDDLSSRSLGGEGGGGKTTLSHLFLSFWYLSVYYYILSFRYTWLRTHAQLTQSAVVSSDLAVGPVRMPLGHRRPCSLISFHSLVSFISAFPLPLFSVWLRGSFPFLFLCLPLPRFLRSDLVRGRGESFPRRRGRGAFLTRSSWRPAPSASSRRLPGAPSPPPAPPRSRGAPRAGVRGGASAAPPWPAVPRAAWPDLSRAATPWSRGCARSTASRAGRTTRATGSWRPWRPRPATAGSRRR